MKNVVKYASLFFLIIKIAYAHDQETVILEKTMDCSTFKVKSETVSYKTDGLSQYKKQTMKINVNPSGVAHSIDLQQKYSPRQDLGGKEALDNVASEWFCLKAKNGENYLWVGFSCSFDARSCRETSEKAEMYDKAGHDLHLSRKSEAQAKLLFKQLGIPFEPPGPYITEEHSITS